VIGVASGGRTGLALLKLEREEGAELKAREENGKRVYDMSVLDNLILTEGTRLFKTGLFLRTGAQENEVEVVMCEGQWSVATSGDVARFWLRYLGCRFTEEPRVTTEKWFDASLRFANEHVMDPVVKNNIYEHVQSELNSNRKLVSPKKFVEEYLPDEYHGQYEHFLEQRGVTLNAFQKDVSDIESRLRRRAYHTSKGVSVIVPEEEGQLVDVEKQKITVHDQLLSVGRK
jgi:hypothetical protein